MKKGFWNGTQPITYSVFDYTVSEVKELPCHWQNSFIGKRRQGLKIFCQNQEFVIDNENGDGFFKVNIGMGSPGYGHKSIVNPLDMVLVHDQFIHTVYRSSEILKENELCDRHCKEVAPAIYEKLKSMKEYFSTKANNPKK